MRREKGRGEDSREEEGRVIRNKGEGREESERGRDDGI